ncbi:MAG: carbohydrate kinase family protein [Burkholderiaceae bacterium]|nr:carbohydrate kinase family protein [Microbacteriaceae bacterium]
MTPPVEFDLFLSGTIFFDIVFTGLPSQPTPGTEVWAEGMGSLPGGIANLAVAAARLGLRTSLAAGFGDDAYGQWAWSLLESQERIDLGRSRTFPGWHSAVTVSLATAGDRSMITHGHPMPITQLELVGIAPPARAVMTELDPAAGDEPWWLAAVPGSPLVFADVGWDPTGLWDVATLRALDHCHAFVPNHVEAMAYTRTDSPTAAVAALADLVPLAIVTRGKDGAVAIDSSTGEKADVPSLPVLSLDPTGAGDVFAAAVITGTLALWPLETRLSFAALCASLAVQHFGGSLAAPGWGDIADWWQVTKADAGRNAATAELARRYAFLDEATRGERTHAVRRADATFGLLTEAERYAPHSHT